MLSPRGGRAAPGRVWLYTPAGLPRIEPPVKPLHTTGCTVSSFQGGLGSVHPTLLCAGCWEELGAPELLAEARRDGRVIATAGELTNDSTDQPWCSCATPSPVRWMDGAPWLGMSCSHKAQGDGYEPTSGSRSAEPKPNGCAGSAGTSGPWLGNGAGHGCAVCRPGSVQPWWQRGVFSTYQAWGGQGAVNQQPLVRVGCRWCPWASGIRAACAPHLPLAG